MSDSFPVEEFKQYVFSNYGGNPNFRENGNPLIFNLATNSGNQDSHARMVEVLVSMGADVNAKSSSGSMTALHMAAGQGNIKIAEILLSHGADVNITEDNNVTPLHLAAKVGNLEAVQILVSHGADVSRKANNGQTPLDAAIHEGNKAVVQYLSSRQ